MQQITFSEACSRATQAIKPPKRTREGWCCFIPVSTDKNERDHRVYGSVSYGAVLEIITHERAVYALMLLGADRDEAEGLLKGIMGETRRRVRIAMDLGMCIEKRKLDNGTD